MRRVVIVVRRVGGGKEREESIVGDVRIRLEDEQ